MKTTMISAAMFVLLSAAASAALANGPMGNSSNSAGATRPTTNTGNRTNWADMRGTRVTPSGIAETSRRAADGLRGTEWTNRGVPGLFQGVLESCSGGRYRWNRSNSCDGAAIDRGRVIADRLERMNRNGELGEYSVSVGARNGYTIGGMSMHTDTAVQVRDRRGNVVGTYLIDNYVGRSVRGTTATTVSTGTVDFDPITGNTTRIRTISPYRYPRGR